MENGHCSAALARPRGPAFPGPACISARSAPLARSGIAPATLVSVEDLDRHFACGAHIACPAVDKNRRGPFGVSGFVVVPFLETHSKAAAMSHAVPNR